MTQAMSQGSVGSGESIDTAFKSTTDLTMELIRLQMEAFKVQLEDMAKQQAEWRKDME